MPSEVKSMPGAGDGVFEIALQGVDPFHVVVFCSGFSLAGDMDALCMSGSLARRGGLRLSVADQHAPGCQCLTYSVGKGGIAGVGHRVEARRDRSPSRSRITCMSLCFVKSAVG